MLIFLGGIVLGTILIIIGNALEKREEAEQERRFRERWEHYQRTGEFVGIERWPD